MFDAFFRGFRPLILLSLLLPVRLPAAPPTPAPEVDEATRERMEALGYEPWVKGSTSDPTGVLIHDRERVAPGYVLITSRGSCSAQLIDNSGRQLHQWQGRKKGFWSDAVLRPDGDLYVVGATNGRFHKEPSARFLRRLSWDSKVEWQSTFPAHHDIESAPGGRLLTLSSVDRPSDLFGAGVHVVDDRVLMLDSNGVILEEYSLDDLFLASADVVELGAHKRRRRREETTVVDAFHANSVEWIEPGNLAGKHPIYRSGNILVCMRHQNLVAVFDRDQRRIVWAWGRGELDGPHSARFLANGNILVFDNGLQRKYSRVVEVDPRSGKIVWQYQAKEPQQFYTPGGGACQRLPNGNTFITETHQARLFEVTPTGEVVWSFVNPLTDPFIMRRATIHAAKRLDTAYVDEVLRNVAKVFTAETPRRGE